MYFIFGYALNWGKDNYKGNKTENVDLAMDVIKKYALNINRVFI